MWMVTNQKTGISASSLQRALGLKSYESAWSCLQRLRTAMVRPGREQLSGEVEVDETYVGGYEKGKGGRHLGKKSLVLIAAEVRGAGTGRIRLQIGDQSKESLLGFVQATVAPGSTVITDGLPVYRNLLDMGYRHLPKAPKNHPSEATQLLPRVHRVAALLKRWVMGIHQGSVSKLRLPGYLNEFAFRFNRRASPERGMVFYRLVQQAVVTGPKTQ
jgi:transposase-like protein